MGLQFGKHSLGVQILWLEIMEEAGQVNTVALAVNSNCKLSTCRPVAKPVIVAKGQRERDESFKTTASLEMHGQNPIKHLVYGVKLWWHYIISSSPATAVITLVVQTLYLQACLATTWISEAFHDSMSCTSADRRLICKYWAQLLLAAFACFAGRLHGSH